MSRDIFLTVAIYFFVLIFFIISCVKYRHVRVLPSVLIILSITFFSIMSPAGKVLLTLGSLKITQESLFVGLRRSGILVGMVFLSRIVISPGRKQSLFHDFGLLGNKLTEVCYWLNLLTEKKISLKRGHIIESIDERLCEIWEEKMPENEITNDSFSDEIQITPTKADISFDLTKGPCNG